MRYLSSFVFSTFIGLSLSGCSGNSDSGVSDEETNIMIEPPVTSALFNPAKKIFPIPNDFMFSAQVPADGTMSAGEANGNPVIAGIDALDGNSVAAPFDIAFSGSLDSSQYLDAASFIAVGASVIPNPAQNVFLLPLAYPSGDGLLQANINGVSVEVPTFAEAISYQTAAALSDATTLMDLANPTARAEIISLDGGTNNVLRITPLRPLQPKTKYLVVITNDVVDINGFPVQPSVSYQTFRDAEQPLVASLEPVRQAVQGWERLATGYFTGFIQAVYEAATLPYSAPSADDIAFSMTFTTGGTTDVLTSMAAPEYFFEQSLTGKYKKEAIVKLVNGTYNLNANNENLSVLDAKINTDINTLLTNPASPKYNAGIAAAIAGGATYDILSTNSSAAYLIQAIAAYASESNRDLASDAQNTVGGLAIQVNKSVAELFAVPAARTTQFFRVDASNTINPALLTPPLNDGDDAIFSTIYQGEITLPMYQSTPKAETGGFESLTSRWIANTEIGGIIDAVNGAAENTTPATDVVSYRYPFATKQEDVTLPLTAVLPNSDMVGAKPEGGWPVIIYVHGINQDRSNALVLGHALANACVTVPGTPCFATIAIDQPLHGIAPSGSIVSGLYSSTDPDFTIVPNIAENIPSSNLTERHFDFTRDAATGYPTPMDYITDSGASGGLFLNLTNFPVARDNLRQMVLDLMNLAASIDSMDVDGDGVANDLDPGRVFVIGHSLGGIDGIPFVAINNSDAVQNSVFSNQPYITAASFLTTGGGVPRLLTNSQSFSSSVLGGLAAASDQLAFGLSGLESYLNVFQGVLDAVDPINFAASLSDSHSVTGVLLGEIVGDGTTDSPSDLVIPNGADADQWGDENAALNTDVAGFTVGNFNAPLSGTEPLITQFGAVKSADATSDSDPAVLVTRFTDGSHGTPVNAGYPGETDSSSFDAYTSEDVFKEMVAQIAIFFAFDGDVNSSIVVNPAVVED